MPRAHARGWLLAARHRRVTWLFVVAALLAGACSSPAPEPEPPVEAAPPAEPAQPVTPIDTEPDEPVDADPSEPAPAPPPPDVPEGRDQLIARIQDLVDEAVQVGSDATLAVLVTDAYGREIASHRPDEPVLPASTLKIVTAAAVLTTIGPDATFRTRLDATAPVDGDGVLRGDLLLVGGGDPTLSTDEYTRWIYPARPRTPLSGLADSLLTLGLTVVEGDVVGIAPDFVGPTRAEGWPDRYFSSFDARYASGLTVDAGLRTILTYPEPEEDELDSDAASEERESDLSGDVGDGEPPEGEEEPDLGPPTVRVDHVLDPAAHAADELIRLLGERGVEVLGEGRSGALSEVTGPIVGRLASIESPPMDELLRFAVQRSDNQITDVMYHAIGRIRTGEGSWDRGDRALRQVLERYGVDHSQAMFADGSGLSREDRVTARLLVDLDRVMSGGPQAETWGSLMAVMGESGTLRERLVGTVAAGRFRGKTGTLRDVTALSGSVAGDSGVPTYHLAVIANDADGLGRSVTRQLMDELALQLSAEVAGCRVTPGEPTETAGTLPRSTISC